MAMKREDRDKWVAALRSGQYRQGTGWLRAVGNSFCCLGVAADLLVRPLEGQQKWSAGGGLGYVLRTESHGCYTRYWHPPGVSEAIAGYLADMNDDGYTFAEIADWIEQNIEVELKRSDEEPSNDWYL